jgi:hypothetical protein
MKTILLTALVMLSGCSMIEITHDQGKLPDVDLIGAEEVCTKKLSAKIKTNRFVITCTIHI